MNVLAIAPHPDDESIGCGGALHNHVLNGDSVAAVFLTSGELGLKHLPREKAWDIREAEARKAAAILGIASTSFLRGPDWTLADSPSSVVEQLRTILEQQRPSIIYLPHPGEWHPDHKVAVAIVRSALESVPDLTPLLRGYEFWTPLTEYKHVEDITSVERVKIRAIRAHSSQTTQFGYVRATLALNAYRGVMAGRCRYAEVFQAIGL
jgi:LmbE family N-acetylglucosaminyl deacetylase